MINLEKKSDMLAIGTALNFMVCNLFLLFIPKLIILWLILFVIIEFLLVGKESIKPTLALLRERWLRTKRSENEPAKSDDIVVPPLSPPPPPPPVVASVTQLPLSVAEKPPRPFSPAPTVPVTVTEQETTINDNAPPEPVTKVMIPVRPHSEPQPRAEVMIAPTLPVTRASVGEVLVPALRPEPFAPVLPRPLVMPKERSSELVNEPRAEILLASVNEITVAAEIVTNIIAQEELPEIKKAKVGRKDIKRRGIRLKSIPSPHS